MLRGRARGARQAVGYILLGSLDAAEEGVARVFGVRRAPCGCEDGDNYCCFQSNDQIDAECRGGRETHASAQPWTRAEHG